MVMLFVLGGILVVIAIGLLSLALSGKEEVQTSGIGRSLAAIEALTAAPKEMQEDEAEPFADRVLRPLQDRALDLGRRLSGTDSSERIRKKLDFAGNPRDWSADRVVSGKVIGAVTLPIIGLALGLLLGVGIPILILIVAVSVVIGFFIPDLYLYQRTYNRSEQMQRDLPDALDLMTISVESGLGFDAAVQQVARNTQGPLAEEFSRVLSEMQIGQSRADALRNLSERTNVVDLKSFVGAMLQADAFGIPIAQVLRVQSSEMRVKRRQRAETKAQQVPVKITIPLVFCILPALFAAVLGPAVISILDSF